MPVSMMVVVRVTDVLPGRRAVHLVSRIAVPGLYVVRPRCGMHQGIKFRGSFVGGLRRPFCVVLVKSEQRVGLVFDGSVEVLVGQIGDLHMATIPPGGRRVSSGKENEQKRRDQQSTLHLDPLAW